MLFPLFLPQLPEKAGEHLTAFILENPSGHLYLVIKLGHLQDIQHRAGAAALGFMLPITARSIRACTMAPAHIWQAPG